MSTVTPVEGATVTKEASAWRPGDCPPAPRLPNLQSAILKPHAQTARRRNVQSLSAQRQNSPGCNARRTSSRQ
jgi:hypothetical protein